MFIDTHCHLNFNDFKDDYLEVIQRSLNSDVFMILIGSELKTSQRAVDLSNKFSKGLYSAVGLHPIHLQDFLVKNNNENGKYEFKSKGENFILQEYQKLINNKNVVAVGEIGLDYFHIKASSPENLKEIKDKQKEVFIQQLYLAKSNNLPVIIHCRDAHDDLYEILNDFYLKNKPNHEWGVIHCFSGDIEQANKYFKLGLKISFTGLITFVNKWDEVIINSPIEKIMIETDSPYLSPDPYRGLRNEPIYVKKVLDKIADLKKIEKSKLENIIFKNSCDFFKIKDF